MPDADFVSAFFLGISVMLILWLSVFFSLAAATLAPFSALTALFLLPLAVLGVRELSLRSSQTWLMLGWLFWLPASLTWSIAPGVSLSQAVVLICLPMGWLAGMALRARGRLEILLERGLPGLLLTLLLWGLLQGPDTFTGKPQGPFNDPNTYAALLNLLILPVLARYLAADLATQPVWLRTGQLALYAGVAFVAFLIASRGAALALLLVLPALLWLARAQPAFMRKLALLAVVTGVSYLAAWATTGGISGVGQRLVDTVEGGDPARIMLLHSAWLMIQDHPWVGSGLATFQLLYPNYRFLEETGTAGGWVHNDYLQLWQAAGLPMLLLLLGVVAWAGWAAWRSLGQRGEEALLRMGYLAGIGAILLHALVNFLFFFALVSLLVGLYLAKAGLSITPRTASGKLVKIPRAARLAVGGYACILGYLLLGLMAVEVLLGEAPIIQRTLLKFGVAYPHYQVAYWLSVLTPTHPLPQQVMGQEASDAYVFTGEADPNVRDEALDRMEAAWQRAPCYLPYANAALALIGQTNSDEKLRGRGEAIAVRSLACDARHGLSYYYAGWLVLPRSETDALAWWRAGLAAAPRRGERVMLATAILARTIPGHEKELELLAMKMANSLRGLEANPGSSADQIFWIGVQDHLRKLTGKRYLELVPPPKP